MPQARIHRALSGIPARQWDALHDGRNPFVAHAFLAGMEAHGVIDARLGWVPYHLGPWEGDALVAAAPSYIKTNSHGEFVFDHAWAHAYAQHGRDYFPKWLCAVPYSPVTGPRLLAVDDASKALLLQAIAALVEEAGLSSAHVNFHAAGEETLFDAGWLPRTDVQYHWCNTAGWPDFGAFLGAMDHKHRKNIRQERAKVAAAGVGFRVVHGDEASDEDLATMHGFYLRTFADYGNTPALTLEFLRHLARAMPRNLVLFLTFTSAELFDQTHYLNHYYLASLLGLDAKMINQLQKPIYAVFQLDGTAYPGNSGSPLYDPESGVVYGVINMVFVKGKKEAVLSNPSGITYAIPATYIQELLRRIEPE